MSLVAAEAFPAAASILSVVQVLRASDPDSFVASQVPELDLDLGGVIGDRHHGITRPSDSRQARFYPRGTLIRNRRQLTLVSIEELAEVAERLNISRLKPEWLGANLLVDGLPGLSSLPCGTRLLFSSGVGLVCEGVNQPCRLPARLLQELFPRSDAQTQFFRAAFGRRGIAASVERAGRIQPSDCIRLVPPQLHAVLE